MITIPAMHPCPELRIDADVPELRLIAHTMTRIHERGHCSALCIQHVRELMLLGVDFGIADDHALSRAVGTAIRHYSYLTNYLIHEQNVEVTEAAAFRPLWAAHIARSIYEQIGA